ncbi:hypothetical protein [Brucella sp. 191011898]|uniref:hypothetical protein n=1 Tax=Brucella sp. 191011898 TaxID=2730447 RepID=UPI0015DE39A0|nr:hypothetical protein [Brucella sp. 191011898]CAB4326606.1 hypothetical protein BCH_01952 [Brucella sp. 191011898]
MFRISFTPQYRGDHLALSKIGDVLTVNGDPLDFSDLPEGGEYPADAIDNPFVRGGVKRTEGIIHITLLLPYSNLNPSQVIAFPSPIMIENDGDIPLPDGRFAEEINAAE